MWDETIAALAGSQFNRFSRAQLIAIECPGWIINHRLAAKRWIAVEEGVFAVAPVLDDPWGRWMGATLTAPDTYLSHWSAARAYRWFDYERGLVTVTRPGNGGPRRHGGVLAYRRPTLPGEVGELRDIAITLPERTLLDLAASGATSKQLGRALRQAARLGDTTIPRVIEFLSTRRQRRGARKLLRAVAKYTGLPIERARSGAEVQAMIVFRDAGYEVPVLNDDVAGEEADLWFGRHRVIVEVDGGPFHQDVGEDARKEEVWRGASLDVRRISSDDVYERPGRLLALVPEAAPR
jgi:hypothetical protein